MSRLKGYGFVFPAVVALSLIAVYPILYNVGLSFSKWNLLRTDSPTGFAGFQNYSRVITDRHFQNSLRVTLEFVVGSVGLSVILGLSLALLLNRETAFHSFMRKILIIPFVLSPALIGYSWRFFLHPEFGIVYFLISGVVPVEEGVFWIADARSAMLALILVDVWQWTPFVTLTFMAGLASIPKELSEAAMVDGATKIQNFLFVTFPLLVPTLLITLIFRTIYSLKEFDKMLLLTKGGPGRATELVSFYIYKQALVVFNMGKSAAAAFLLAIIMAALLALLVKVLVRPRAKS
ncbi:MAG: sugar ABC transporter permease [Albidovulum sp.]|nr:sugar ABC transporter permease [Albidovulum sp.]